MSISKVPSTPFDDRTLPEILDEVALLEGDRQWIMVDADALSFGSASRQSTLLARALSNLGIRAGDHVALLLPDSPEWVVVWFALLRLGAVAVPINGRVRSEELGYLLEDSHTRLLIYSDALVGEDLRALIEEKVRNSSPGSADGSWLQTTLCLGSSPDRRSYASIGELADGLTNPEKLADIPAASAVRGGTKASQDPAILIYTSGSTGFPKGVLLSHRNILLDSHYCCLAMGIRPDDRWFSPMPFFHVGGCVWGIGVTLASRSQLFSLSKFDAQEALRVMSAQRCTILVGVETMHFRMLSELADRPVELPNLRLGAATGTPDFVKTVAQSYPSAIFMSWGTGLTECTANVALPHHDDPPELRLDTNGRPHPGIEIKVVSPSTGDALLPGEEGELCYRGWATMIGYYGDPDSTAAIKDGDGWIHSGDKGVILSNGYVRFLGRIKDVLKVGGQLIAAESIEYVLCQSPKVRFAAVVSIPDAELAEVPVAFVELTSGVAISGDELKEFCRSRVSGFSVPRHIFVVASDEWPMTQSGKVSKEILRKKAEELVV